MKNVSGYIQRKTLLYKTDVEYGDYTVNHIQGCAHGCLYPCYAFLMAKRFKGVSSYEEWIQPKIVSNALELLDKEIPKYKNKIDNVHLCFTTDPFMYGYDEISDLSIEIIKRLNKDSIKCSALTKGILPFELASLSNQNEYGITLISLNEAYREKNEPYAAKYEDRIKSLRKLHDAGNKTWVSIEPYPTPNIIQQDINELLESIAFTDKIIFGRLNYNPIVTKYKDYKTFFNDQSDIVINFCIKNNIKYHIKNGTVTIESEKAVI